MIEKNRVVENDVATTTITTTITITANGLNMIKKEVLQKWHWEWIYHESQMQKKFQINFEKQQNNFK